MAPKDPNIALSLASVLLARQPARAATLFRSVAAKGGPREAWQGLAGAEFLLGQPESAAQALSQALSTAMVAPGIEALADAIARRSNNAGWCGINPGDGGALIIRLHQPGTPYLRLDGQRLGQTVLPPGWTTANTLEVLAEDGKHLLGSPINLVRLRQITGYVEAADGGLRGWAWYPANPDALPRLLIQPSSGHAGFSVTPSDTSIIVDDAGALARPRGFTVSAEQLGVHPGPWHVRSLEGQGLLGSPLDPWAIRNAASAIAHTLAHLYPSRLPGADGPSENPRPRGRARQSRTPGLDLFGLSHAPMPIGPPPPSPPDVLEHRPVDMVIPVHNNAPVVLACLHSVLPTLPSETIAIVVDDASTEPALREALDQLAACRRIRLIRHTHNLGFPASANAGIAAARGDVVLLNSDTLVPRDWLARLREAVYATSGIGTATPLSNEATILSYPMSGGGNPAPDQRQTERLAALAWRTHGKRSLEIPVGVGFCLYIRRDCLDAVGMLRADVFAQGYGEENDFCLRARALGWRNVAVPGVFVTHCGGGSFGGAGRHLLRRNQRLLNQLHPGYDALIEAFGREDPLAGARRDLDLARWRAARPRSASGRPGTVLLITHAAGGGVEQRVRHACQAHRAAGRRPIVLRPARSEDGRMAALLDGHVGPPDTDPAHPLPATPDHADRFPNLRFQLPEELPALLRLLRAESIAVVEMHHFLDHHPVIHDLPALLAVPHEVHVHDYAWFCPRVALVDAERRYCGEPPPAGCETCIARGGRFIPEDIPVTALIERSARFLKTARCVIVPSQDTARRMRRHFPGLRPVVLPHEADPSRPSLSSSATPDPPQCIDSPGGRDIPRQAGGGFRDETPLESKPMPRERARVCIAGAIGLHKGYDVLLACAQDAARRDLDIEFVVVGTTTDDAALLATERVFITGPYEQTEVVSLIQAQHPRLGLLPSIWPETWCLALTALWQAGLEVVAFDVGAQAERIARRGRGQVVPLGLPAEEINNVLVAAICRERDTKVC